MVNPNTLPNEQTFCPKECLFLSERCFIPDSLPHYCDKYEQFLGVDTDGKTARCAVCRMMAEHIVSQGLSFISAYTVSHIDIMDTKEAFLGMDASFQGMFVELIKKTGRQIGIPLGGQAQPEVLTDIVLHEWQEANQWLGSPELKDFRSVLGDLSSGPSALLARQTQSLLENLFQVLDKSERAMLKGLMSNRGTAEVLLEQLKSIPKDNSLLKNFRHMLYENSEKERRRQQKEYEQQTRMMINKMMRRNDGRGAR
ncbi:MAG: hypothetical protein IKY98_04085 [Alphaproteobacteria bacterium]|nr:hypothetical protein [Alphaproteobacteria bacterium]